MGINYEEAAVLCAARRGGASFEKTLTIGRLSLCLHPGEARRLQAAFPELRLDFLINHRFGDYADRFFTEGLGARSLNVLDYSAYQGADIVHDLNRPAPESLRGRYDAVVDGGSLEHVFNFPVAVAGLMDAVKTGGALFMTSPCNNLPGHGFYQFSPELMFRVFAPANGFRLDRVLLFEAVSPSVELTRNKKIYQVADPAAVRSRVGFVSKAPVTMMVQATKTRDAVLFDPPPLQSDYAPLWSAPGGAATPRRGPREALRALYRKVPFGLRAWIDRRRELKRYALGNKTFFKRERL